MKARRFFPGIVACMVLACTGGPGRTAGSIPASVSPASTGPQPSAMASNAASPEGPINVLDLSDFTPLDAGTTYFVDPDFDVATPLRVVFTVPAPGWSSWSGTFKDEDPLVGISIVEVTNLTEDACRNPASADPPIGPTVANLARALTKLYPFEVVEPSTEVTRWGYSGKHLKVRVSDELAVELRDGEPYFTDCLGGHLQTWKARVLSFAFRGYGPDFTEEYWILDVEGTRLVVASNVGPNARPETIAERDQILESLLIEP